MPAFECFGNSGDVFRRVATTTASDVNEAALRELARLGLTPGVTLTIEHRNTAATLSVRAAASPEPIRLTNDLAGRILIAKS